MKLNTVALVVVMCALSIGGTYVTLQDRLVTNHPLNLEQQLESDGLTYVNTMLLTDILRPTFDTVSLIGVSKTNSCAAFQKGCFGNQERTEKEFADHTGRGPQIGLLVYNTASPITESEIRELKKRLGQAPYSITDNTGAGIDVDRTGVASLYSFAVLADINDTQIRIVIRPIE